MATETIIQKESPAVEAYKLGLMEKAKELIEKEDTAPLPTLGFADQSQLTKDAIDLAQSGVGGFAGFIPQAAGTIQQGIGSLGQAGQTVGQAQDLTNLALSGYAPIQSGALAGLGQASELGQAAALGGMQGIGDTLAGTQADKFMAQAQLFGTGEQFSPLGQAQPFPFPFPLAKSEAPGQMMEQTGSVVQGQPPVVGPGGQPLPSITDPKTVPPQSPLPSPMPLPTPQGIAQFFNPYENQVVQQALADVQRASDIAGQQDAAQAVSAGAFGGSRQAIMEAERARNLMDQQGQLAGQLRQAGFGQAMTQAQKAFEDAKARQLQKAQISGQLGAQYGQLGLAGQEAASKLGLAGADLTGQMAQAAGQIGQQGAQLGLTGAANLGALAGQQGAQAETFGKLGQTQAGLGQLGQQMMFQDVDALTKLGAQQQQYEQAQLDQQQKEALQTYYQPYQKLGFYSDILQGAPTTQQTISQSSAPTPSAASQIAGAGITGLSLASAGKNLGII
jgi:hypothetical protein